MRFLIITHVAHKLEQGKYFAYEPYVREMNLWLKYVDHVHIVAPISLEKRTAIDSHYEHDNLMLTKIPSIAFISFSKALLSILSIPIILIKLFSACRKADHIHLRCPGNIGLLGVCVQLFFPKKIKTAKYAGNWDPKSKQPFSYRLQKRILSHSKLTKNMTALVYGDFGDTSKNIKPFFTASFKKEDIKPIIKRDYKGQVKFLFIGSLAPGKRPLYAIKLIHELINRHVDASLDVYGDGVLKKSLKTYIDQNQLEAQVNVFGNQPIDIIKKAMSEAHFVVLPSKSEGWPKVLAEAMFYGTLPIATAISCIPFMLDNGSRGILIDAELTKDAEHIIAVLKKGDLLKLQENAVHWSQQYTLEHFEAEIKKLVIV